MEFDALYRELQNSTEMIHALLLGVSQQDSQVKPNSDSWSILEVLCHLYDEEREDFREHLDFILYRQEDEWHVIDPEGWVRARKYNEQNFVLMQEKFFSERKQSLEWLRQLSASNWDSTYSSHYGSMSAGEMLACWGAHDNLHIRQLVELRRFRLEHMSQPHNLEYAGGW
jgi:hypothetical protein